MKRMEKKTPQVWMRKSIALLIVGLSTGTIWGNTEWHSNPAKNTSTQAEGNAALTNMVYWKDANGNVGSGAPTANDDLIFDNNATSGRQAAAPAVFDSQLHRQFAPNRHGRPEQHGGV